MPIRDRIRPIKHLQNKYFICVLENPNDIVNIASAIRNISAFGVEKLYIIGGDKKLLQSFESSRSNKRLTNFSVGANKWVFVKHFDTTDECVLHLKKNLPTHSLNGLWRLGEAYGEPGWRHPQYSNNIWLHELMKNTTSRHRWII